MMQQTMQINTSMHIKRICRCLLLYSLWTFVLGKCNQSGVILIHVCGCNRRRLMQGF